MSLNQSLLETNINALEEGAELLTLLETDQYTQGYKPAFQSTIGAHFRHVLEHYRCFLGQMESGTFCYDNRERDQLLECDSDYASATIVELIDKLKNLQPSEFDKEYSVEDHQTEASVRTSLHRELLFLQSHTVHHYAIIGAMTRAFGKRPDEDFGVAIATREHQKSCNKDQTIGEPPTCAQ